MEELSHELEVQVRLRSGLLQHFALLIRDIERNGGLHARNTLHACDVIPALVTAFTSAVVNGIYKCMHACIYTYTYTYT